MAITFQLQLLQIKKAYHHEGKTPNFNIIKKLNLLTQNLKRYRVLKMAQVRWNPVWTGLNSFDTFLTKYFSSTKIDNRYPKLGDRSTKLGPSNIDLPILEC